MKAAINELAVRGKIEAFGILLQNQYSALTEQDELSVQARNEKLTNIITGCAIEVGSKVVKQDTGKFFPETKDLNKKRSKRKSL